MNTIGKKEYTPHAIREKLQPTGRENYVGHVLVPSQSFGLARRRRHGQARGITVVDIVTGGTEQHMTPYKVSEKHIERCIFKEYTTGRAHLLWVETTVACWDMSAAVHVLHGLETPIFSGR